MRAHRVDSNQAEIVKALRDYGCTVAVTSSLGHGFPDLVVGIAGLNLLFELKASEKDKLTKDEKAFHEKWGGSVFVITSPADAVFTVSCALQDAADA